MHERERVSNAVNDLILKHCLDEIVVCGVPVYQMTKVGIIGNIMSSKTTKKSITTNGMIAGKLANAESSSIKRRIEERNNFPDSIMYITRGLYSEEGIDYFIDYFIKEEQGVNKIIIDRLMNGNFNKHIYPSKYTTLDFQKLTNSINLSDLNTLHKERILNFEMDLKKLGYDGNYAKFFIHNAKKLKSEYILYKYFIVEHNVTKVYLTMGYTHIPLLKACKDMGVETVEVQYGNISNMHGGFSSISPNEVYSDKLLIWNSLYAEILENNPSKKEVFVPYNLRFDEVKKKEQLLVIVQRLEIKEFIDIAGNLRASNPNIKIIYKIHPLQKLSAKDIKVLKKANIVIGDKETKQLINESKWVMSGYSSALIEAAFAKSIPLINHDISFSTEFDFLAEKKFMHIYKNDSVLQYSYCEPMSRKSKEIDGKNCNND